MGKFFLFLILWRLIGNPFIAIVVILAIFYVLDRRFIGLSPSITRPFKRNRRLSAVRRELESRPHDTRSKLEAARLLMEKKKYREALDYLEQVLPVMDDSAEVLVETGICRLKTGDTEGGEASILQGLELNPRVHYGEPYLRLGEAFKTSDPEKAVRYLQQFREVHSSSCEAYYRLGQLYELMGRKSEAADAYAEAVRIYRGLPKYKRKSERKWALLARMK
ncbi:tetratricopeptide repeat protein [Gorillibacterium sp. sgz5001074]|uniref:tetratricopeptide repeat protein n=1 Tax=Gorillibacterium sp. sgz5001074 TaxID=3446695 RepID=UPI003F668E81